MHLESFYGRDSVRVMVSNVIFNNISVISWRSDFSVEETGIHGENHRPVVSHGQTLFHVYRRKILLTNWE